MGFRLRRGHAIGKEARRLYEDQLRAAAHALRHGGRDAHAIRKHVKKARAVLSAARDEIGSTYAIANEELKTANRALGRLADAHRIVETVDLLKGFDLAAMPDAAIDRLRLALVRRAESLEREVAADQMRPRAERVILSALARQWRADTFDDASLARAVRTAHAQARAIRRRVARRPTIDSYHEWRQRVKREWYLVRLIADHTGNRLADDQHRLAALDACLGRLHDVGVLTKVVATEPLLPRRERVRALITLRALMRDLRRKSGILAVALDDRPGLVRRRVLAMWGMPPRQEAA